MVFLSLYATQGCGAIGAPQVLQVDMVEAMVWGLRLQHGILETDVHLMELSYDLGQVTCPSVPTGKERVVSNGEKMCIPPWTCRVSFTFKAGGM